ncbi:hypothetical protein ACPRNU_10500 [Chromobacterium vaccinii]|uniref:hypothetical protein n=1 Tax=Chromobacterium vaccinii TaxID=1108595 RepID=UPI003C7826E6
MERKTRLRLAAGLGALVIAAAAAGLLWRSSHEVRVERLALDEAPGSKLAAGIMNRAYGRLQHDEARNCWRYLRENGSDYCLSPLSLDRVEAGGQHRLYLFASGRKDGAGTRDLAGLVGAFVVDADSRAVIAANKALDFVNDSAAGPRQVQLLQLSGDGYMGWYAAGRAAATGADFPHFYAPRDDKVIEIGGDVFGRNAAIPAGVKFEYQIDDSRKQARVYPLTLTVRDGRDRQLANLDFKFDRNRWRYVCADDDCRMRGGIPLRASGDAQALAPADANEALFGQGRKLSDADLNDVLGQLGVRYVAKDDAAGFIDQNGCDEPYQLDGSFERDGGQEQLWVRGGNTCTSGVVGSSAWVFVRDADGRLRANLGLPAADIRRDVGVSAGVHDLRVGAAGFCDGVWRWNGKTFVHLKDIATRPGGCGGPVGA